MVGLVIVINDQATVGNKYFGYECGSDLFIYGFYVIDLFLKQGVDTVLDKFLFLSWTFKRLKVDLYIETLERI